jgi:hypothetical protein
VLPIASENMLFIRPHHTTAVVQARLELSSNAVGMGPRKEYVAGIGTAIIAVCHKWDVLDPLEELSQRDLDAG